MTQTHQAPKKKILAVDDDPMVLKSLKRWFKEYDWTTSESATNALHLLKDESFDLIITDVRMPDMDGLEFLKQVHKLEHSESDQIPTEKIILTGYDDREAVESCLQNIQAYRIEKPWGDGLGITLKRALESRDQKQSFRSNSSILKDLVAELEMLLDGLSECTYSPVLITDSIGRVELVNKTAENILQRTQNDLIGIPLHHIVAGLEWFYLQAFGPNSENEEISKTLETKLIPKKSEPLPAIAHWKKLENKHSPWKGVAINFEILTKS